MAETILVAYATRNRSTAEIAEEIGRQLTAEGHKTDVVELKNVSSLAGYTAVVIGTPVYTGRILSDVDRFSQRHRDSLARLPVAGFVTGIAPVYPPTGDVRTFTEQLEKAFQPKTLVTVTMFAGMLDPDKLSFIERGMTSLLKVPTGDFRNWDLIRSWARALPSLLK